MKKNDFALILSSDLFRLRKLRSVFIGLALMFVLMFLTFAICWVGYNLTDRIDVGEGTLNEDGVIVDENGTPVISQQEKDAMLTMFDELNRESLMSSASVASIEFFVMIIVCIFVGKDFSNGTMRLAISRGTSRVHAYFSKWLSMALLVTAYSLFALLVCGVLFSVKKAAFTGHDFAILARCFSLELLVSISTMSIFMMIAFLCRSSGSSLGVSIGLYIVLQVVLTVVSTVMQISDVNTDWTMFMPLQQMAIASYSAKYSTAQLCAVIIMPIFYTAASIFIGLYTFMKRDVK